jgi:Zn-dependent peptidase ImmA (M78 family)/DNA-binding XRE family transcriptional regulator
VEKRMAMALEAHITPEIVRWARERLDVSTEELAQKVPVKPEKLVEWETGHDQPSFRQARRISKALRIPFGYLFLTRPPAEPTPVPDLRTIADAEPARLSVDLVDVIHDALRKQDWYRERMREEEFEPVPFVGAFAMTAHEEDVADHVRDTLGIDGGLRQRSRSWEEFLRYLVLNAEERRILVMRSSVVGNNSHRPLSVSEFRGFALSDPVAPLLFINSRDAKAAQVFTLVHELAHLWIGESGISNLNMRGSPSAEHSRIERYCNGVAAEVLIPSGELREKWNPRESLDEAIFRLVREFRVSSLVVLRRALDLGLIDRDSFFHRYDIELARQRPVRTSQGGDPFATYWTRNSKRLTEAVLSSALEGQMLYRDAARLLGVKVKTLQGLAERLGEQ